MAGFLVTGQVAAPPAADRLLVVMSDIEMGNGGHTDDFPHSDFLGELIVSYNGPRYRDLPVELVFNGDTFDLLKTPWRGACPSHITAAIALGKLAQVAAAHPAFFAALRTFLAHPHAERRVHLSVRGLPPGSWPKPDGGGVGSRRHTQPGKFSLIPIGNSLPRQSEGWTYVVASE